MDADGRKMKTGIEMRAAGHMDTFDHLWERHLRNQADRKLMTKEQIEALRRAFFTGAWCHLKFTQRMLQAENAVAIELMIAAETELSDAVGTHLKTKLTSPLAPLTNKTTMKPLLKFTLLTGWLIPAAFALWYFSRWIREIVVPTLKGGSFDQLYDLHRVSYLHVTTWTMLPAFAWATLVVLVVARKFISAK